MAFLKEITNSILRITGSGTLFYDEAVYLLVDRQIAVGGRPPCTEVHTPVVELPSLVRCTLAGYLLAHYSLFFCRNRNDIECNNSRLGT